MVQRVVFFLVLVVVVVLSDPVDVVAFVYFEFVFQVVDLPLWVRTMELDFFLFWLVELAWTYAGCEEVA